MRGSEKQKVPTLCFACGCIDCEWMKEARPVHGWDAEVSLIPNGKKEAVHSYHVKACPKFRAMTNEDKQISDASYAQTLAEKVLESAMRDYTTDKMLANKFPDSEEFKDNLRASRSWFRTPYAEILTENAKDIPNMLDTVIGNHTSMSEVVKK